MDVRSTASGEILTLEAVKKIYGEGSTSVAALAGVSVSFRSASFTAIMGPSGSGKSTLLHCAAGLDVPTSGSIMLDGTELAHLDETELTLLRRDRIGFVFQSFNLLPALTAEQNITLPLQLAGRKPDRRHLGAVIEQVGLGKRRNHLPSQLSGGQQQRVAIARAMATQPSVIFADEPTGALDSRSAREVMEMLRLVVDRGGQTVVLVTHDPAIAAYADRVLFLADGQVVSQMPNPTAEAVAERMTNLTEWVHRDSAEVVAANASWVGGH